MKLKSNAFKQFCEQMNGNILKNLRWQIAAFKAH